MESKYRAARVFELLALGLSVWASWSSVLLKGVLSVHVAPTPEGRRSVLMIFCGLASGDSLLLQVSEKRSNAAVSEVLWCDVLSKNNPKVSKCN